MYDPLQAFHKTQTNNKSFTMTLYKIPRATDVALKQKQYVPGPGKYNHDTGLKTFYKPYYKTKR